LLYFRTVISRFTDILFGWVNLELGKGKDIHGEYLKQHRGPQASL
jgi:hypothetical protein